MNTRHPQQPAERLDELPVANTVVRYEPRATVFTQGERCASVMYIRKGRIKLTVRSRAGRVAVVAVLRAGSFFGEGVLAGERQRRCTAETLAISTIARVKTRDMRRGLSEHPELTNHFLSHLLARNARTESDLVEQLLNRREKRLARALLLLANFDAHYLPRAPLPAMSRNLLADIAGLTRDRVDVLMTKFRELGFIESGGGSTQVHRSLLTVVTQE